VAQGHGETDRQLLYNLHISNKLMSLLYAAAALTFWHRDLTGYSRPFGYDIIFARHLNFSTWFTKNFIIPGTKKIE
jgi:hypothetical protein